MTNTQWLTDVGEAIRESYFKGAIELIEALRLLDSLLNPEDWKD
jgi:hypothetical protein